MTEHHVDTHAPTGPDFSRTADDLLWKSRLHALGHRRVERPHPTSRIAIVACMDSRLTVERLFDLRPGEAHVLRNAGGTVTQDVLRGLLVSQRLLGTRTVLLVHHTDCGMRGLDEDGLRAEIERETGSAPPFGFHSFADVVDDLRRSMTTIRECPWLPRRDDVRGYVYRVEDGRLEPVHVET